jgi:predicted nucleotide-binding protein (sugar kinase/HSP70/actin superfamily)
MTEEARMAKIEDMMKRVDALKADKSKAEGVIENIRSKWKEELGTDDPAEVEKLVQEAEKDVKELSTAYDEAISEAETLLQQAEAAR